MEQTLTLFGELTDDILFISIILIFLFSLIPMILVWFKLNEKERNEKGNKKAVKAATWSIFILSFAFIPLLLFGIGTFTGIYK